MVPVPHLCAPSHDLGAGDASIWTRVILCGGIADSISDREHKENRGCNPTYSIGQAFQD
jgi:hypothetical protein